MEQTKHTPGPWTASKDGYIDAPDGALVAKIHTEGQGADYDARLIAAAPDLLAALLDAHERLTGDRSMSRAAIAKATAPK